MSVHCHLDFETRSAVDLGKAGAHVYASHSSTDAWCAAWCIGDGPIEVWTPQCPGNIRKLFDALAAGALLFAHNAAFELAVWNRLLAPRYGWPKLPIAQTRCVMAQAYAMALPASLDGAAAAVHLDIGKDIEGKALMMQLARPRKVTDGPNGEQIKVLEALAARYRQEGDKSNADRVSAEAIALRTASGKEYTWWDTPEKLDRLYAYCRQDVEVERRMASVLLPLSADEQDIWVLDQQINNRGILLDLNAIDRAMAVVTEAKARLDQRMAVVTAGAVRTCSQVQALKDWLETRGIGADGLAKADVTALLSQDDLPTDARSAILLRQEAAKSSTAKLKAMRVCANDDNRARGIHQYWGANTGRWSGRRIQGQNLPRTTMPQADIDEVLERLS